MQDAELQLNFEKLVSEINYKAVNLYVKLLDNHAEDHDGIKKQNDAVSEELIRHIILFLALKYAKNPRLAEKAIKSEIINLENCTMQQANSIFDSMRGLGLHQCCIMSSCVEYDLLEFALMRRYVKQSDSFVTNLLALYMLYNTQPLKKSDLLKKFKEQYGSRESWDEQTHEEYSKEIETINQKHAEASAQIFANAFEELDYDEEKFNQYSKYVAVRFADDNEKQLFERMFDD